MTARIFQSVFGIQTGDIVTTSYESGPYEMIMATVGPFSDFEDEP